jgi:hypothetical protein
LDLGFELAHLGRITYSKGANPMLQRLLGKPWLVAVALAATFALTPSSVKAQHGGGGGGGGEGGGGGATLSASLAGTDADPGAFGGATFRDRGRSAVLEIEVQDVTYSDDVLVVLNGEVISELFLEDGAGAVELEAEHIGTVFYYQPPQDAPIPVEAGDEINVIDANDGTVLLVGFFG